MGCSSGGGGGGGGDPSYPYVCPNGTPKSGMTSMENTEKCASCTTALYTLTSDDTCRTPYLCPNGVSAGVTSTPNTEKCASCNSIATHYLAPDETCDVWSMGTPPSTIVLWSAGQEDGDFGFSKCQTLLNSNSVPTTDGGRIGQALRGAGYTKAVFFGSTPDYPFVDIDDDADALGMQTGFGTHATGINVRTAKWENGAAAYTDTFGGSMRTLGNLVGVASGGGWQTGGGEIINALISGTFWSFTNNQSYSSLQNCRGATSTASVDRGIIGQYNSVISTSSAVDGISDSNAGVRNCGTNQAVLCIAR